jgi:hypothetical protein
LTASPEFIMLFHLFILWFREYHHEFILFYFPSFIGTIYVILSNAYFININYVQDSEKDVQIEERNGKMSKYECPKNALLDTFLFSVFLFLLLCWVGVHCGIYKSSYSVSTISYLSLPSPSFSFISSPPFLASFQQVSQLHIHPPIPFSTSSPSTGPTSPDRTCSTLLFCDCVE